MAITEVGICNNALVYVGAALINSLDDQEKRAVLCKEQYPKRRDLLLRSHPWNFASRRIALTLTGNTPAFEFTSEYNLPADYLRVLSTNQPNEVKWAIELNAAGNQKVIVAEVSSLKILYLAKITNPAIYEDSFAEALSLDLARNINYSLTQNAGQQDRIEKKYEEQIRNARSFDAQEKSLQRVSADEFTNVRRAGGVGFPPFSI